MVYDRQDRIEPFAQRKVGYQVHRNRLEWKGVRSGWNSIGRGFIWVRFRFVLLTGRTSLDIVFDPVLHSRPPEGFLQAVDGAISTWVSGCGGVMIPPQKQSLQRVVWGNGESIVHIIEAVILELETEVFSPPVHDLFPFPL
jgi:hypothetical protein